MAIAYLLGKGASKALHTKVNVPVLMVLAILPDIDIIFDLLTGASIHRGPTHSIAAITLVFIPLFILYRQKAVPYFLALISHPLIGDFLIGGQLTLFWPFSTANFGLHELGFYYIGIYSPINIVLETTLFLIAAAVLIKSGDWKVFFTDNTTNLVLIIPLATVLLPSTIGYPFSESLFFTVPVLAAAHLFYLALFVIAVLKTLGSLYGKYFSHPRKAKPSF